MKYRTLGRTGLKVSEIGLGGEWFNGLTAEERTAIVDAAQEHGINYIDIFMPQVPTRDNLGIALKSRGKRLDRRSDVQHQPRLRYGGSRH